jgi:hypothetical protein
MPYTPPSTQSPVASKSPTPALSRSQSYNRSTFQEDEKSRSSLPHSASRAYLNKNRRSPSVPKSPTTATVSSPPDCTPQKHALKDNDVQREYSEGGQKSPNRLNVSTDSSPPISPQISSDEEATIRRGRKRDMTKLAELKAAIRIIEQHRAGSPDGRASEEIIESRTNLGLPKPRLNLSTSANGSQPEHSPRLPLSAGARKISHSRSSTDTNAFFNFPRKEYDSPAQGTSQSDDEDIEDDELRMKPPLIRKKSGELVRPALRASSTKRRPLSMPGTPTYSKAVHFQDNSLEHVRHFHQVDRPIAVSAGSSPVESYDEDDDFPFGNGESGLRSPPFEWEIRPSNIPRDTFERQALPVRTERIYLSPDTKILIGCVAVQNLAFNKLVVARFTLDYWKTTSEVVAEYNNDVRKTQTSDGCDRFIFHIKLEDQVNLENKTMFFCVRYQVNGYDYWDSNDSMNYQVDFSKKYQPQSVKLGGQAKNARPPVLPRSRPSATFSPRPRSMPSFDDFGDMVAPYDFSSFPQPSSMVGGSPIRFKNRASTQDIVPDAPGRPKSSSNQQAFGNRYDFRASLTAAIQAGGNSSGGGSPPTRDEIKSALPNTVSERPPTVKSQPVADAAKAGKDIEASKPDQLDGPKPTALTAEKPSLSSSSYHELLDKYCFVCSRPAKGYAKTVR